MNEVENLINGQDSITQAGISMNAEPLGKRKLKWQVYTITVPFTIEYNGNGMPIAIKHSRVAFETTSHKTNERVVGITLYSDFKDGLNESTIQFSIDSEEILPSNFDCSLISTKKDVGFYKNMYRMNERANGSLIKGEYTDNSLLNDTLRWIEQHPELQEYVDGMSNPPGGFKYTVKLYLWCIQKPLSQNNKGL